MSTPLEENACDVLTRRTSRLQRHQETIRRIYHRVSEQPDIAHLRRRAELAFYRVGKLILGSKAIPDKKKPRPEKSRPTPPVFSADDDTVDLRPGLRRQEISDLLEGFGYEESPEGYLNETGDYVVQFRHRYTALSEHWFMFEYHYSDQGQDSWIEGELRHSDSFTPKLRGEFSSHFTVKAWCLHFREDLERIPELERRMIDAAAVMRDPVPSRTRKSQRRNTPPTPPVFSADDDTAARELIDAAYDVVEICDVNGSPYNQVWKQAWLKRANEIVPQFF